MAILQRFTFDDTSWINSGFTNLVSKTVTIPNNTSTEVIITPSDLKYTFDRYCAIIVQVEAAFSANATGFRQVRLFRKTDERSDSQGNFKISASPSGVTVINLTSIFGAGERGKEDRLAINLWQNSGSSMSVTLQIKVLIVG